MRLLHGIRLRLSPRPKLRRRQLCALAGCLSLVASPLLDTLLPFVRLAENASKDLRIAALTPARSQSDRIVIAAVNEDTLAALPYRSPLDRRFLSGLLRTLERKGARAIGIDVLMDQPSEPEKDRVLRETLLELRVPRVVAFAERADGLTTRQSAFMESYLEGIPKGIPMLSIERRDPTIRAIRLRREREGHTEPSMVAELAHELGIAVPDLELLPLRFRGSPESGISPFPVFPAHAIQLLPDEWIRDRIVLIGVDLDLVDRHTSPFALYAPSGGPDMPGIVLQAHALSQLLEGRTAPPSSPWLSGLTLALAASLAPCLALWALHPMLQGLLLLTFGSLLWVFGAVLFHLTGLLIPLVLPSLTLASSVLLTYGLLWKEEANQRRFIQSAFSKFLSKSLVDQLAENPDRLRVSGERRQVSFVFTDIASYTTLTESLEPEALVRVMNEYLDVACAIVLEHGGFIEKIVGDALNVIFNAPVEQPDHANRAMACALALDRFCQSFAEKQRELGLTFGDTRIGVHTGTAVVGNFGGEQRFDYSAKGDAINTAARLESVNRYFGTRICVSECTASHCPNVGFRPVGELLLKGKSESVTAFEPLSNGTPACCTIDDYLYAYELLRAHPDDALRAFRSLSEKYPDDALVRFHCHRLIAGARGTRILLEEK